MTILQTIILGVVEGITEFLPISSTAHIMIAAEFLKISQSAFIKSFEIAIQLGAVFAVLSLYFRKMVSDPKIIAKIIAAFVPTALIGFGLYPFIKSHLIGNFQAVFWSLLIGGIILILVEIYENKKEARETAALAISEIGNTAPSAMSPDPSYIQAFGIGVVQALAVIPGVSRSAATIIAGRLFGLSKTTALEFSFLLALPTIAAATGYDAFKNASVFDGNVHILVIGFIVSFLTAILTIKFLLAFVKNHSFISFGVYRIILAGLILLLIL